MEQLAARVDASGILLVVLGGRQGCMAQAVASRLAADLSVKGKKPALVRRAWLDYTKPAQSRRRESAARATLPSRRIGAPPEVSLLAMSPPDNAPS